jgi:hypothetical protein
LTRRDFQLIAGVVRQFAEDGFLAPATAELLADRFADELYQTNERFDRGRFMRACEPAEAPVK